jgi:hypothetical protein
MPEHNGATPSSSFEDLVREYRGRPPTTKETQRILACNRLLTTTDFDPVTVFLTVFGEEFDRSAERVEAAAKQVEATSAARLDRIETLLRRNGKPATEPVVSPPVRVLMVVAATIAACVGVVVLFGLGEATFARVLAAFALGAASTLGYVALAPRIGRRS